MNEASIRLCLHHALQYRGYWPLHHQDARSCPHCHKLITPEIKGRPDTEARHTRFPIAMIEVKAVGVNDLAFPFKEISEDQRHYLTAWSEEGGQSYLCLGKIVPMGVKSKIHSICVIPWLDWLAIESVNGAESKSIIYDRTFYANNVRVGEKALMEILPEAYKLFGASTDWHLQDEHPLAVQPETLTPFFKRVKAKENPHGTNTTAQDGSLSAT